MTLLLCYCPYFQVSEYKYNIMSYVVHHESLLPCPEHLAKKMEVLAMVDSYG